MSSWPIFFVCFFFPKCRMPRLRQWRILKRQTFCPSKSEDRTRSTAVACLGAVGLVAQENRHGDTRRKSNHLFHNQGHSPATPPTFFSLANSLKWMNPSKGGGIKVGPVQEGEPLTQALTKTHGRFMLSWKQRPQVLCRPYGGSANHQITLSIVKRKKLSVSIFQCKRAPTQIYTVDLKEYIRQLLMFI